MMIFDDELLDRFLDGDVTDDEAISVTKWLDQPANLKRFAHRAQLHADLRSFLRRRSIQSAAVECQQSAGTSGTDVRGAKVAVSRSRRSFTPARLIFVAAMIAMACLFAVDWSEKNLQPSGSSEFLVEIADQVDAILIHEQAPWQFGGLVAGRYRLKQGLLHLKCDGGVMVYVEAPAEFEAVSGKRLLLHTGRLSANVPPEGIGFSVETPEAEVVDFGTEFSIDVETGTSEVHVFNGLVRVHPRSKVGGEQRDAVDLRTAQAIKIGDSADDPVGIEIARDRFIRNFDEPKRSYVRSIKQLDPVAFYRMPIRDRGLVSVPEQFSGVVLTGEGRRPPHAPGMFAGGSLRIKADSRGRGGRVDTPCSLQTGQLTLTVLVFLESNANGGVVVTNIENERGNFSLHLDSSGRMQVAIRNPSGSLISLSSTAALPLATWTQVVVVVDEDKLRLYENGRPVASVSCSAISFRKDEPIWFGTDSAATALWDGRIDEVAFFDTALSDLDIDSLFQVAEEEMIRSEQISQ